jgi:hypothetical protein
MFDLATGLDAFRRYQPDECGPDGYPLAWHDLGDGIGVKHLVREQAEHRCVRCLHPYRCGVDSPEWSRCDDQCRHDGPTRTYLPDNPLAVMPVSVGGQWPAEAVTDAQWRVLTVHHLCLGADAKRDLRWWNLAALCQRCHLTIQGRVLMERVWPWPHSEWFKPYAAGWYAWSYLGEDLSREEVDERLDELLALELATGTALDNNEGAT